MLAECFEVLGGVPKTVLADRMGCLKAGVVANVVVPTADYVRFAAHYRFRPDFCQAADPESKGIVENLVGYAKRDLIVPAGPVVSDLAAANRSAAGWCAEVNAAVHSEICAVPARAARARTRAARPAAVAAAGDRRTAGQPQGRQAVLRPVRVGAVFGAEPAHRHHRADRRARHEDPGARAVHRRDRRRACAGRAGRGQHRRRALRVVPAGQAAARAAAPDRRRRSSSWRSARPRRRSWPARRRPGLRTWPREIGEILTLQAAHGASRAHRGAGTGGRSSGGGGPVTCARSWPRPAPRRGPAPPGRRWCSTCRPCRSGRCRDYKFGGDPA